MERGGEGGGDILFAGFDGTALQAAAVEAAVGEGDEREIGGGFNQAGDDWAHAVDAIDDGLQGENEVFLGGCGDGVNGALLGVKRLRADFEVGFDELEFCSDFSDLMGEDGFESGGVDQDNLCGGLGGYGVAGTAAVKRLEGDCVFAAGVEDAGDEFDGVSAAFVNLESRVTPTKPANAEFDEGKVAGMGRFGVGVAD